MNGATNIRVLADRVARHPMLASTPFETVVDYVVDFLRIVDVPALYEDRVATLDVRDHRAALPCGFVEMVQVRQLHGDGRPVRDGAYVEDGASFPHGGRGRGRGLRNQTYKVQGNVLYTSDREGKVQVAYRAIATDGEGLPLIPDSPKFLRAAEAYIKRQVFTVLFDLGRLSQAQMANAQQDYAFAVGACESEFRMPDIDGYESLYNSFCTLVPRVRAHASGFAGADVPEEITVH